MNEETMKKNLAVDLLRISWWLQTGSDQMADRFIEISSKKYSEIYGHKIIRGLIGDWMERIKERKDGDLRAAERALTLANLL